MRTMMVLRTGDPAKWQRQLTSGNAPESFLEVLNPRFSEKETETQRSPETRPHI